jgi:DNA modification methylase
MKSLHIVANIQQIHIHRIKMYRRNARAHSAAQIQQIAASIQEFGFVNPILVGTDYTIVAGHARLRAAQELGMTTVPVIVLAHLSAAQRRALVLADNQLALNAGWDEALLREELAALRKQEFDLALIGFEEQELARLLAEQEESEGQCDPDDVPTLLSSPVTRTGDLWLLGKHHLLCGDATDSATVQQVMAGEMAQMVFMDPPYAVGYEGTARRVTIENDNLGEGFYEFLREACANLMLVCQGAIYICMAASELHTLHRAFGDARGHWSTFLIWAKDHFALGRADYQRQYEPILYGWPEGAKRYWCGDCNQGDIWFIKRPAANRDHPTMKPVELVERAIENSSRSGDIIFDPFAGSGTTLIACERKKRHARLVEIDPKYVDVICRRWEQFTGTPAVLDGPARTFQEVAEERQDDEPRVA